MNREIKFRVWDKGREQMWYKDTKTVDENEIVLNFFASGIGWGLYDSRLGNRLVTGDPNAIFNTPGILMQYTGLKDKNGKDGYHKDIVSAGKKLYIIELQNEEARFLLLPTGSNIGTWKFMDELTHMEIIGNAYETPHLLNSEQGAQESDTTEAK